MSSFRTRLEDASIALRFIRALPGFLRHPIDRSRAPDVVRQRLASREADFLALLRDKVYGHAGSPYLPLLRHAGCQLGDVERLVARDGLEGALLALYRAGVYVATGELRGAQSIVRGSLTFHPEPAAFRNPSSKPHFTLTSGGSGGALRGHLLDLETLRDSALVAGLAHDVHGVVPESLAAWDTPGPVMIAVSLNIAAYFGRAPARWFCHVDLDSGAIPRRLLASWAILTRIGRLMGYRFPQPESATARDVTPVLHWLQDELRRGRRPCVFTFPSSAVQLALAAVERGVDLSGGLALVTGEPLTPARLETIRGCGLSVASIYGASECGAVGHSCLSPVQVDDMHVVEDLHALIRLEGAAGEPSAMPENALLLSSLRPTARLILLNASMGDTGVLEQRACGCPLERLGWRTHLHSIRSFEKLTGAGMTFRDADVTRVLEHELPRRFGGSMLDYQLEEGEGARGESVLVLRVHPRVGPVDEAEAARLLLAGLGRDSDVGKVMAQVWSDGGVVHVRREAPTLTAGGKILHFRPARR